MPIIRSSRGSERESIRRALDAEPRISLFLTLD
jgi:hypothetical protein